MSQSRMQVADSCCGFFSLKTGVYAMAGLDFFQGILTVLLGLLVLTMPEVKQIHRPLAALAAALCTVLGFQCAFLNICSYSMCSSDVAFCFHVYCSISRDTRWSIIICTMRRRVSTKNFIQISSITLTPLTRQAICALFHQVFAHCSISHASHETTSVLPCPDTGLFLKWCSKLWLLFYPGALSCVSK